SVWGLYFWDDSLAIIQRQVQQLQAQERQLKEQARKLDDQAKALEQQPRGAAPALAPPTSFLPGDRERMNEALTKMHGIIRTRMLGAIDQLQYTLQGLSQGGLVENFNATLTKVKDHASAIESAEKDIEAVFQDANYGTLEADLRQVVKPSGYRVRMTLDMQ